MLLAGEGNAAAVDCVSTNDVQDLGVFLAW